MEALSGATLGADVLANGAFPPKTVLELPRQLCASLEIVHDADLLHRDIKPDNVFLSGNGRVVLIDSGSARGFAQGQVKRLTRLVTRGYAAPEQYAFQTVFGTYTDVYSLAATLYYAIEGLMPPLATDSMLGARLEFRNAGQLQAGLENLILSIGVIVEIFAVFVQNDIFLVIGVTVIGADLSLLTSKTIFTKYKFSILTGTGERLLDYFENKHDAL